MERMDRRAFVRVGMGVVAGLALPGCGIASTGPGATAAPRLAARPGIPDLEAEIGVTALGLEAGRDGILAVPDAYDPSRAWPLFVALHGAGGAGAAWRTFFERESPRGIVMMAPDARGGTWDVVRGSFGSDVTFVDRALEHTFRRVRVDPARICLAGFSDGASYALSLGLPNGDLFTHVAAFSPGFMVSTEERGLPGIFVSHGTRDPILSHAATEGQLVPALEAAGYDVTFHSFDGGHRVRLEVADAALRWFLA